MPKGYGYKTGGKHAPPGLAAYDSGSKAPVDVSIKGAGMGNQQGPNVKDYAKPGGYGSTGKRSDSSPSKG
jgi:hypothetical protein